MPPTAWAQGPALPKLVAHTYAGTACPQLHRGPDAAWRQAGDASPLSTTVEGLCAVDQCVNLVSLGVRVARTRPSGFLSGFPSLNRVCTAPVPAS